MNREQVLDILYSARTSEQIERAKKLRSDYLKSHPDDEEVIEVGEMLTTLEFASHSNPAFSMHNTEKLVTGSKS